MTYVLWQGPKGSANAPTSGDFETASNWSSGSVPDSSSDVIMKAGAYTVRLADVLNAAVHSFDIGSGAAFDLAGSALEVGVASINSGTIVASDTFVFFDTSFLNLGEVDGEAVNGTVPNFTGAITNDGVISTLVGSAMPGLLVQQTLDNDVGGVVETKGGGTITLLSATSNEGLIEADNGGTITGTGFGQTGSVTNLSGGTLTGGTWATAAGSTLDLAGSAITTLGAGTLVELGGAASQFTTTDSGGTTTALEDSLSTVATGATLEILAGRTFAVEHTLVVEGTLLMSGGVFSPSYQTQVYSLLAGYGTVNDANINEVRADVDPNDRGQTLDLDFCAVQGSASGKGTLELSGSLDEIGGGVKLSVSNLLLDADDLLLNGRLSYGHHLTLMAGTVDLASDAVLQLSGQQEFKGGDVKGESATCLLKLQGTATSTGSVSITVAVANSGTVTVKHGGLDVDSAVTGKGKFIMNGADYLNFDHNSSVASTQGVEFEGKGGELILRGAPAFHGVLSGFGGKSSIDLSQVEFSSAHYSYKAANNGKSGTLTVTSTGISVSLHFDGVYHKSDFSLSDNGGTGVTIRYVGSGSHAALPSSGAFGDAAMHPFAGAEQPMLGHCAWEHPLGLHPLAIA